MFLHKYNFHFNIFILIIKNIDQYNTKTKILKLKNFYK